MKSHVFLRTFVCGLLTIVFMSACQNPKNSMADSAGPGSPAPTPVPGWPGSILVMSPLADEEFLQKFNTVALSGQDKQGQRPEDRQKSIRVHLSQIDAKSLALVLSAKREMKTVWNQGCSADELAEYSLLPITEKLEQSGSKTDVTASVVCLKGRVNLTNYARISAQRLILIDSEAYASEEDDTYKSVKKGESYGPAPLHISTIHLNLLGRNRFVVFSKPGNTSYSTGRVLNFEFWSLSGDGKLSFESYGRDLTND